MQNVSFANLINSTAGIETLILRVPQLLLLHIKLHRFLHQVFILER